MEDKQILRALEPVVEGIAELFGSNCEVVLHCLEDLSHSVVKIIHGHVSGREVGAPMTDLGLEILESADPSESDVIGSYYVKHPDGRPIKAVAILVRNKQRRPIGMICINIDLSFPLLSCLLESLSHDDGLPRSATEHYPMSVQELLNQTLETVVTYINSQKGLAPSHKNKAVVEELCGRGIFEISGAIDVTAKAMGISRYTVYNYIREAKLKGEPVNK